MSGLRPLPARRVIRALRSLGFVELRRRGSHVVMGHADGRRIVVPMHSREDIGRGLLRKIIRESGADTDDFLSRA